MVCHGTSANCFSDDGYIPLLNAGFALLTPSRPGYGRTPLKLGATAAQAAEALVGLLDNLNIETCAILAISGGGPTGVALAANHPQRVRRLALIAAVTQPEARINEASFESQRAFYGPLHGATWAMLGLLSRLSPYRMAKQTLAIFSTHSPEDALRRLSADDVAAVSRFYQRLSSRRGALNDLTHTVGKDLLQGMRAPTLVIHSREDRAVPFSHAEWAMQHIPRAALCESGFTGHFYWIGPDYQRISQELIAFFRVNTVLS